MAYKIDSYTNSYEINPSTYPLTNCSYSRIDEIICNDEIDINNVPVVFRAKNLD